MTLVFYPNGRVQLSAWARDPGTGNYVKATSKVGHWQLEVHSVWTGILHVTLDGSQPEREYLEIFSNRQIGTSRFPLSDNNRLLFVNRSP